MSATTWKWPKRPRQLNHPILGKRERWNEATGAYRVERFPDDGDPRFIALAATKAQNSTMNAFRVIGRHHTLKAAQRACKLHLRIQARKAFKREQRTVRTTKSRNPKIPRLSQSHLF